MLDGRKILIAGPCSAESEAQVLACSGAVSRMGADFFRAGVWKPRTRPGSFEGLGETALPWLVKAAEISGIRAITEVAGASHVQSCLDAGLDAFWIGARTTTNPFLIQEIADALRGTGCKVFVKNPVSPDVDLWAGAIERLIDAGLDGIVAVFRGFTSISAGVYRNAPLWNAVVKLRSRFPGIPVICDPSHIAGDASLVPEVAQKAMDLGLDGLMVECHPNPHAALSDPLQQLTFEELESMIDNLSIRSSVSVDAAFNEDLAVFRAEIDEIDSCLVSQLARRMEISRRIGEQKRNRNVSIIQPERWGSIISDVLAQAAREGLDEDFVRNLFAMIHEESVKQQQ